MVHISDENLVTCYFTVTNKLLQPSLNSVFDVVGATPPLDPAPRKRGCMERERESKFESGMRGALKIYRASVKRYVADRLPNRSGPSAHSIQD